MIDFRHMYGAVYIFENSRAKLVKVGMTTNDVTSRLGDINDMWLERKVTCQICGGRLVNFNGRVPQHVVSGRKCHGGNELPFEKDTSLAEAYLENMIGRHHKLSGSEKGSSTRRIENLRRRIDVFQHRERPIGIWQINTVFYTDCAERVELLSHEILEEYLDKTVSFGEVFVCSISEAIKAVETSLNKLGLLDSATKEIYKYVTSDKHGQCSICGNNLTESGSCPACMQRFLLQ